MGDWNARHQSWNGSISNAAGQQLHDLQLHAGLRVLHPGVHTYQSPCAAATESSINHVVTNCAVDIINVVRYEDLFSDHWAFGFSVGAAATKISESTPNWQKANWCLFATKMREEIRELPLPNDPETIDSTINNLVDALNRARASAVPNHQVRWQTQKTPADTLGAIKKLRRLRRKLNRNRNAPDVDETKSLISRCRKILEELTTRDRNNSWSKLTKDIEQNPKKFWRIAKTLRGGSQEMPALKADNGKDFVLNTQEKAEIMATEFESYHQPGRDPRNSDNPKRLKNS